MVMAPVAPTAGAFVICGLYPLRVALFPLHLFHILLWRFSHAGSRPVGLPAEYKSYLTCRLITGTGK